MRSRAGGSSDAVRHRAVLLVVPYPHRLVNNFAHVGRWRLALTSDGPLTFRRSARWRSPLLLTVIALVALVVVARRLEGFQQFVGVGFEFLLGAADEPTGLNICQSLAHRHAEQHRVALRLDGPFFCRLTRCLGLLAIGLVLRFEFVELLRGGGHLVPRDADLRGEVLLRAPFPFASLGLP